MRIRTAAPAVVALCLAMSGCSGQDGSAQPTPTSWAGAPTAALAGTGLVLAGAPATEEESSVSALVADGAGSAWLPGPWAVTRVDPASGDSTTWDAADDWAFAQGPMFVPSAGSGVWMVTKDRARLFDGTGFTADLAIPEGMVQPDGGDQDPDGDDYRIETYLVSGAEHGSDLWLSVRHVDAEDESSESRILRWSGGEWSVMADHGSGVGGDLAIDTDGGVWAGAVADPPDGVKVGLRRWDGTKWSRPDPPKSVSAGGYVAADPTGGVWVLGHPRGEERGSEPTQPVGLARFDGAKWRSISADVVPDVGQPTAVRGQGQGLAATSAGSVWVSGATAAAEYRSDGTSRTFGSDEGVPVSSSDPPVVAVAGDRVLARNRANLLRLDGDRFAQLWSDPIWSTEGSGNPVAASEHEAWTLAFRPGETIEQPQSLDGEWTGPPLGWARYQDGAWSAVGPAVFRRGRPAALATDGALWALTSQGLVRYVGQDWRAVAPDVIEGPDDGISWNDPRVVAGPEGSVWTNIPDGTIVGVGTDGSRAPIGRPPGYSFAVPRAGGADGSVWVSSPPTADEPSLARWDGKWSIVALPKGVDEVEELVTATDGSLWAALLRDQDTGGTALGRYADGEWALFPEESAHSLAAAPESVVCAGRPVAGPIRCYDPDGLVGAITFEAWYDDFDIAPDGSVWIRGEQITRLPGSAPRR
ncbi:MAG: hypothetical protein WCF04_08735 [Candidatus Nanopelagicales bacterium]